MLAVRDHDLQVAVWRSLSGDLYLYYTYLYLPICMYNNYLSVSILSLGVNLSVLQFVLNQYMPEIKTFAQLVGIASGTLVNYLGVKRWIFNEK